MLGLYPIIPSILYNVIRAQLDTYHLFYYNSHYSKLNGLASSFIKIFIFTIMFCFSIFWKNFYTRPKISLRKKSFQSFFWLLRFLKLDLQGLWQLGWIRESLRSSLWSQEVYFRSWDYYFSRRFYFLRIFHFYRSFCSYSSRFLFGIKIF